MQRTSWRLSPVFQKHSERDIRGVTPGSWEAWKLFSPALDEWSSRVEGPSHVHGQ